MNNQKYALLLLVGLWACSPEPELILQTVRLDLTPCLGPLKDFEKSPDSSCGRLKVNTIIDSQASANGCLTLMRSGGPNEHHLLRWQDGELKFLAATVSQNELQGQLQASLVLYAMEIDQSACDSQRLDSQCGGQCIVRLRDQVQVTQTSTGAVEIDFSSDKLGENSCDALWNEDIHASLEEVCDGVDNNCNGLVDEPEQCCTRHEDCQATLADLFCDPVLLECVGCSRNSDCENKFERRTFCNIETGRCGECDPQRDANSSHRCPTTEPRCITTENGRNECRDCKPNGPIEENGCAYDRPCFAGTNPADPPYCARCGRSSDCPEPLECFLEGNQSSPFYGSCQACSPVNSGPNVRCEAIDEGVNPYCSERGACVPCVPESQADACPEEMPYCLPTEDGSYSCRPCETDLDCLNLSPAEPYCDRVTNRCFSCRPDTRDGCSGSTPICNSDGNSCRRCTASDTCAPGTCVTVDIDLDCDSVNAGEINELCLQVGQCRECDLVDGEADPNQNCTALNRSTCRNNTCIGCETNADCSAETPSCSHLGHCTQCPIAFAFLSESRQVDYRCDESGDTPICSPAGNCQTCDSDGDCLARPGSLNVCEAGRCVGCRDAQVNGCTDPGKPICDIRPDSSVCVACVDSSHCRDGFSCMDFECIGGCNPVTQTGCEAEQPVCSDRADCRFCTTTDCLSDNNAIAGLCADTTACRLCVNPDNSLPNADAGDDRSDQAPNHDAGVFQRIKPSSPRESAYGCVEDSSRPICNNGACAPCRNSEQCADRPGSNDYCLPTGLCTPCLPDSGGRNDDGCTTREAPFCRRGENGYECAQCADTRDCADDRLICIEGRCQECDLTTHIGCPEAYPICRNLSDEGIRCTPCGVHGECRVKECQDDENCVSSAICNSNDGRCWACNPDITCLNNQACNAERECVRCVDDNDCGEQPAGQTCQDGLCLAPCERDNTCQQQFYSCDDGNCGFCEPGEICSTGQPCAYLDNFPFPICLSCRDAACPPGLLCELETGRCVP
jgi:hypothetical protein